MTSTRRMNFTASAPTVRCCRERAKSIHREKPPAQFTGLSAGLLRATGHLSAAARSPAVGARTGYAITSANGTNSISLLAGRRQQRVQRQVRVIVEIVIIARGSCVKPWSALVELNQTGGMERVMGIEPTYAAWKAAVLPLNYTRNPQILPPRHRLSTCAMIARVRRIFCLTCGRRTESLGRTWFWRIQCPAAHSGPLL